MLPRATTQGGMWLDAMDVWLHDAIRTGAAQAGASTPGTSVQATVGRGPPYAGFCPSLFALCESPIPNPQSRKRKGDPAGPPLHITAPTLNVFDDARTCG